MKEIHNDNRTLWLVRHGESTWNKHGLVQGQADEATLTRRGRRQVEHLAKVFRHHSVDAIYSSDLRRTQQTASILGHELELPIHTAPVLRERHFGILEGAPLSSLDLAVTGIYRDRVLDTEARPLGGESLNELYCRSRTFVDWLWDQPFQNGFIVVTHGGIVRTIRAYCQGISADDMTWDLVPNASVWPLRQQVVSRPAHYQRHNTDTEETQ